MEVFNRWKTARMHLHQAVEPFLNASMELHTAATHGSLYHSRSPELEDLARKIRDELADDAIEIKFAKSRAMAHRMMNMSAALSPINMLPSELLSRIFLFTISSNNFCVLQGNQDPARVMSSVCSRWRQIALTTCSLWSHIHLFPASGDSDDQEKSLKTTELWIERAGGIPLHIHILPARHTDRSSRLLPWHVSILQLHVGRFSSIELQEATEPIMHSCFTAVSQDRTPGILKHFKVSSDHDSPSTRGLTWPMERLHGLVDLQLIGLHFTASPEPEKLMCILANSTSLQTLRLTKTEMIPGTPIVVHLPSLKLLDVIYFDPFKLAMLLTAITVGDAELDLRTSFHPIDPDFAALDALSEFTARSNVVSLYLYEIHSSGHQHIQRLVLSMPSLRVLVVRDTRYYFRLVRHRVDSELDKVTVRLPKIHTLVVSGCLRPGAETQLRGFIDAYPLHTIVLDGCGLFTYKGLDKYGDRYMKEEPIETWGNGFKQELAERVQSVRITDGTIDCDVGQLDLYMQRLIQESKSCTV